MPYDNAKRKVWRAAGYPTNMGSAAAALPPPGKFIRLYHLLKAEHAKSNIENRRLKVSRFADVNDPFELMSLSVMDGSIRKAVREHKAVEDVKTGLICFSEDWTSPVMWGHYAEKHHGVCLGFDVARTAVNPVRYFDKRIRAELGEDGNPFTLSADTQEALRHTKCSEWSYEREHRILMPIEDAIEETIAGRVMQFRPFDAKVKLTEVILGEKCAESLVDIRHLVAAHCPGAIVFKARLAWKHFKVVPVESTVP